MSAHTPPALCFGHYSMQGKRQHMEDRLVALAHPTFNALCAATAEQRATDAAAVNADDAPPTPQQPHRHFFAVFDGHAGFVAAEYCRRHLHLNVTRSRFYPETSTSSSSSSSGDDGTTPPWHALVDGIRATEQRFYRECRKRGLADSSGTCAVIVYIVDDHVTIANVGDSRAVLCRAGRAVDLSSDHKPGRPDERARVDRAGGVVARSPVHARAAMLRRMHRVAASSSASRPVKMEFGVADSLAALASSSASASASSASRPTPTCIRPLSHTANPDDNGADAIGDDVVDDDMRPPACSRYRVGFTDRDRCRTSTRAHVATYTGSELTRSWLCCRASSSSTCCPDPRPWRVFPGGLSVSRALGDVGMKVCYHGGGGGGGDGGDGGDGDGGRKALAAPPSSSSRSAKIKAKQWAAAAAAARDGPSPASPSLSSSTAPVASSSSSVPYSSLSDDNEDEDDDDDGTVGGDGSGIGDDDDDDDVAAVVRRSQFVVSALPEVAEFKMLRLRDADDDADNDNDDNDADDDRRGACMTACDEFIILACDGVWDVMSSQHAVDCVRAELLRHRVAATAAAATSTATGDGTHASASGAGAYVPPSMQDQRRHREQRLRQQHRDDGSTSSSSSSSSNDGGGDRTRSCDQAAQRLACEAYARGSGDNISIVVVQLA